MGRWPPPPPSLEKRHGEIKSRRKRELDVVTSILTILPYGDREVIASLHSLRRKKQRDEVKMNKEERGMATSILTIFLKGMGR
jgi:hypothetical protein